MLLDYRAKKEYKLDNIPDAVRTYPASAGSIMMPLTPGNNWTATVMFCGGSNIATAEYVSPLYSPLLNMEILTCVYL